ncbi:hypothetical protein H2200_001400 [Cladophialophora chaetospira]|uniref:(S)-ureidoglycine aminohydrolase cupin domain-containing protein n=1 Tax=Cladophialophora chaetospira TaxID=386627 RepID=A0AA39CPK4_9EURO|nr:hypothetical protein H2200_001400 [Cladophialophora chaetospira]
MSSPMPLHFPKAQSEFEIPHLANGNIFLGDVVGSIDSSDPAPISGGLFRMTKGEPFTATYKYHETLIVLEGSFDISDDQGKSVKASAGDLYWIPKGATVTIGTEDSGLAFYTAQRSKRQ